MAEEAAEGVVTDGAVEDAGIGVVGEPTEGETGEAASGAQEEPELFTVKIGGREEQVTLEDLTSGYMRQGDYTRKTQELAREREQVAQMQALAVALDRDPRTTLIALASAMGVNLGQAQAPAAVEGDADPLDLLSRKIDTLTGTFTQQQAAAQAAAQKAQSDALIQAQINAELADLAARRGEFDQKTLIQYAVDHGTTNLEVAFLAWQAEQAEQAKIAEKNRAVAAKRSAQVVAGGQGTGGAGTVVPGSSSRPSIREAFEAAIAAAQ